MVNLPDFNDPLVQAALAVLNDTETSPPEGEHWEGFSARRIVAAVLAKLAAQEPVAWRYASGGGYRLVGADGSLLNLTKTNVYLRPAAPEAPAQTTPSKLPIPPAGADALAVVYAEGWNAACDAFFGGKPAPEPVVVTVESIPHQWREAMKVAREALRSVLEDTGIAEDDWNRAAFGKAYAALAQLDALGGVE